MTVNPAGNKRERITAVTFLSALTVAFSTWFAAGYSHAQVNVPQNLILRWIRQIQCDRMTPVMATGLDAASANPDVQLWCLELPENQTSLHLRSNGTLSAIWGMVGCAVMLGVAVAAWATSYLVDWLGFRKTFLVCNILQLIGAAASGLNVVAHSFELFVIGRFIFGFGNAFGCTACGVYIAEITPNSHRGALSVLITACFSSGMLVAGIVGLPQLLGTEPNWQHMTWILLLPAVVFFVSFPFLPESPRWHYKKISNVGQLTAIIKRLRGAEDVEQEVTAIEMECNKDQPQPEKVSIFGLFRDDFLCRNILICIAAIAAQRLTGYPAIYVYSTEIFRQCGIAKQLASYGTVALSGLQVIVAVLGSRLLDKVGRRPLLLIGLFGCSVCTMGMVVFAVLTKYGLCVGCQYGNLVALMLFMVFYIIGPASIPYLLPAEMFGMTSRQSASALVLITSLSISTVIAAVFPIMQVHLMEWTFTVFAGVTVTLAAGLSKLVIETKGKSFLEIKETLEDSYYGRGESLKVLAPVHTSTDTSKEKV